MDQFVKDKVRVTYEKLLEFSEKRLYEVPKLLYKQCGYKLKNEYPENVEEWDDFGRNDRVSGKDKHFWFFAELKTPNVGVGKHIELEFRTGKEGLWDALNPQGLLYLNGEVIQGIDTNHYTAVVEENKDYKILVYFYTGMNECDVNFRINVKEVDLRLRKLYYDLKTAYDAAMCYDESNYIFIKSMKALEQVCNRIDFREPLSDKSFESIDDAQSYMQKEYFEKECGHTDSVVSYLGHTH